MNINDAIEQAEGNMKLALIQLKELNELMKNGQDDERGDRLRDQMEPIWYSLTEEEQERFGQWSEDLYKEW